MYGMGVKGNRGLLSVCSHSSLTLAVIIIYTRSLRLKSRLQAGHQAPAQHSGWSLSQKPPSLHRLTCSYAVRLVSRCSSARSRGGGGNGEDELFGNV